MGCEKEEVSTRIVNMRDIYNVAVRCKRGFQITRGASRAGN